MKTIIILDKTYHKLLGTDIAMNCDGIDWFDEVYDKQAADGMSYYCYIFYKNTIQDLDFYCKIV